jgi:predicted permease
VRQLLTESIVVSLVGGAAGVFLAWALTRALPSFAPESFPRLEDIRVDPGVLLFAVAVSVLTGLVSGVLPALRGARPVGATGMRATTPALAGRGGRTRMALLAGEAALAVVLLVGAALVVRSFAALIGVDQGFDPGNVLTARVYLTGAAAEPARAAQVANALTERVRSIPGVTAAGAGNMAPLGESSFISGFSLPRSGSDATPVMARALTYVVTPGYAEALGLDLVSGRFFREGDVTSGMNVMLVNDAFVRTYLNDGRPVVGRQLVHVSEASTEIVGIIADVLKDGPDTTPQPEIYLAHGPSNRIRREINLVLRTTGDPAAMIPSLRAAVREVEPFAAIGEVGPLAASVAHAVSEPRFVATILAGFACLALVLAATGLYGVLSYTISQRRHELGVRAALGASRGDLVSTIVRQGLTVTVAGLVAGMLAAAVVTPLMQRLLFGVTPLDAPSFAIAPLLLLSVAVLACAIPARRAGAVDPAEALRAE